MKQNKDDQVIEKTNKIINELVLPKWELQKAYNYYNGIMDAEQYRYIEENYGIGQPTAVTFIPLIKKHIDALIGEFIGTPIIPKVICKDTDTLNNIERERQINITNEVYAFLQKQLKSSLLSFVQGKDITDKSIERELNELIEDLDTNFTSQYEIAAQNIITYIMQSKDADLLTKLRMCFLDLLTTGYTFFKVLPSASNTNIKIEAYSPLNVFIEKNPESIYVKDSKRAVVRKWLTKEDILNTYGKDLTSEDIAQLKDNWDSAFSSSAYYVRTYSNVGTPGSEGLRAGENIAIPGYPSNSYNKFNNRLIPVYEVEWLDVDKDYVMHRHSATKIGDNNIFIINDIDLGVVRTKDNPSYCTLSLDGVYFINRENEPYSLVMACASLQDKYNLLHFYRDVLIGNSGTPGDWVDLSLIPTILGDNISERLQKWFAYKKGGIGLLDTSQEGRMVNGQAPLNTIFNGFDATVKSEAVQAIQMAIDAVDQTTSSITGVFRERLNGIQQRDAVTNVQTSVNNSFTITKQYYHQMDLVTIEILVGCLDMAKIVYKNGLTGSIILGEEKSKIFTALPEHYTITDYDIQVTTCTDIMKDMEQLKAVIPELIKSALLPADVILDALTTKSLTELKIKVRRALAKQKQDNNQLQQLMQQNQQLQQQLQEAQSQVQQMSQKLQQLNSTDLQLKQQELKSKMDIEMFKAQTDRQYKTASIDNDIKRTQIEYSQQFDGNPYNDKVKQ